MSTTSPPVSEITTLSDQAISWVVKLNSGTATKLDIEQAQLWRTRSRSHQQAYLEAEQLWLDMGDALLLSASVQAQTTSVSTKIPRRNFKPVTRWLTPLAAAVLLFAVLNPYLGFSDRWLSDYHTTAGEQKTITRSDGSRVMLNTDSALSVQISSSGRQIRLLRGQAVFSVATDPKRPFEVTTDDAIVKALGTIFEVQEDQQGTRVSVQQHAVNIKPVATQSGINDKTITEGQQTRYSAKTGFSPITSIDIKETSAWQRGKLIVKNQPLSVVITELDRYYPGHIQLTDQQLANLRVTGVFPLNDPNAVLTMIEQTLPLKQTRITPWLTLISRL